MPGIKPDIQKYIFQIRYKPTLSFYEKLFKLDKIFDEFVHWQTDRLRVTLRDYDKRHSLTIKHDATTFESDKPSNSIAQKVLKNVTDNFNEYSNNSSIKRLGARYIGFIRNELSFEELNNILKLKVLDKEFLETISGDEVYDHSVAFNTIVNELTCKVNMGPIKKNEINQFFNFNSENHLDPASSDKHRDLAKIYDGYPEVSFYYDMDISINSSEDGELDIMKFHSKSYEVHNSLIKGISNFIFKEKLN